MTFLRIVIRLSLFVEHDLFRKPLHTFRDHVYFSAALSFPRTANEHLDELARIIKDLIEPVRIALRIGGGSTLRTGVARPLVTIVVLFRDAFVWFSQRRRCGGGVAQDLRDRHLPARQQATLRVATGRTVEGVIFKIAKRALRFGFRQGHLVPARQAAHYISPSPLAG